MANNNIDFNEVVSERIQQIESVLKSKADEYASGSDRFHNFNVAARVEGTTPEKALKGMMMKHIVSVFDLIDWVDSPLNRKKITPAIINEKIGDNINYLILLEGLLRKRVLENNASDRSEETYA